MSIDIEKLKRKALAARPGPWYYKEEGITGGVYAPVSRPLDLDWPVFGGDHYEGYLPPSDLNVQYVIEANPQAVLELIERLQAAEKEASKHYQAGWIQAAKWADRSDLISDIDSPAYKRDMQAAISKAQP